MAEHYGTAIIPARPFRPKDKAAVEGSVGVASSWILAALRNQQFLSLAELNGAIAEKLHSFNHKPFQKKEGSRTAAFEEERLFLQPLPATPFELAVRKIATVQYNYHVSVERMNYSVPYEYIKQQVDIRLTRSTVEVFFQGARIASHPRLYGRPNQYNTLESHMPPDHREYLQWNGKRFIQWAEKIGENTTSMIRFFLTAHPVEQQGYKACMTLLKLSDRYSPQRLEAACKKALAFSPCPSIKSIQSILKSGQDKLSAEGPVQVQNTTNSHRFTRSAYRDYMKKLKKVRLLILDEWLLYPLKESESRDVLELVEARNKIASTIFCSQYDTTEWHENLYDPNLADAVCDRLIHDSYTIQIEGGSMRKRKAITE